MEQEARSTGKRELVRDQEDPLRPHEAKRALLYAGGRRLELSSITGRRCLSSSLPPRVAGVEASPDEEDQGGGAGEDEKEEEEEALVLERDPSGRRRLRHLGRADQSSPPRSSMLGSWDPCAR